MTRYTRRQFVASGAIAMAAASTSFCGTDTARSQAATRLRCFWWGNPDRDKRTKARSMPIKKRTGTEIAAESLGWGDYWTKLGTQTAGGNAPDLIPDGLPIPLRVRAARHAAAARKAHPDAARPHDIQRAARDGGKVDGKL